MEKYILYCTPEQTKKALELGAPIYTTNEPLYRHPHEYKYWVAVDIQGNFYAAKIPTTEQMLGWLEEQKNIWKINVDRCPVLQWYYAINSEPSMNIRANNLYSSRKEATLAAIDAALELFKR